MKLYWVVLLSAASALPAGQERTYLRRIRLEPDPWKQRVAVEPGTTIDQAGAFEIAAGVRRRLIDEGYADARVEPELLPVAFRQADLRLHVDTGPRYRLCHIDFRGDLGLSEVLLQKAVRHSRKAFSDRNLAADLARIESLYFRHGYLEARIAASGVELDKGSARVTIEADAGPRYEVAGEDPCVCAGRHGRLRVELFGSGRVRFTALPEAQQDSYVGRIEFRGHHAFGDGTLRRALLFDEGDAFHPEALRRSLARLRQIGLVPQASLTRRGDSAIVDLTITITEPSRGRWWLSGPNTLQFGISSRLPAWASTCSVSLTAILFTPPYLRVAPWAHLYTNRAVAALERPYVPGQAWLSGFRWSPQLTPADMLAGYVMTHVQRGVRAALGLEEADAPERVILIERPGQGRSPERLLCEQPFSRWRSVLRWIF